MLDHHYGVFQFLRNARKYLAPVPRNQDVVFDTDSPPIWQVYTRFDGDYHARFKGFLDAFSQSRSFMNVEAEPVSEPVPEVLAVTRLLNNGSGNCIDVFARHTRPNCINRRKLRLQHNSVHFLQFRR